MDKIQAIDFVKDQISKLCAIRLADKHIDDLLKARGERVLAEADRLRDQHRFILENIKKQKTAK